MSNIFMSAENSKTNDSKRFRLYYTDKIDLGGNIRFIRFINSLHLV